MPDLARTIESTLLRADADEHSIVNLCRQALTHNFIGVCVNPCRVALARSLLTGSQTRLVTVVGFPLGANESSVKHIEAQTAVENGAQEIDMVLNIGVLKDRQLERLTREIAAIVEIGVPVKLIIETGLLNDEEMRTAVTCGVSAGVRFIKTSTGYGPRGASIQDIASLRALLPGSVGIKASGGIKDLTQALGLLEAGAERLGTSAAAAVYREYLHLYDVNGDRR